MSRTKLQKNKRIWGQQPIYFAQVRPAAIHFGTFFSMIANYKAILVKNSHFRPLKPIHLLNFFVIAVAILDSACGAPDDTIVRNVAVASPGTTELYPETIFLPPGIGTYATGKILADGTAETIPCMTCHATIPTAKTQTNPMDPKQFHQDISLVHGNLECLSCHDRENRNALRLASGSLLEFRETVQLCAQCHGLQYRDYTHGAHGGMNGYWDRSKGERTKNGCIVCHSPHNPKIQPVVPVLVPNDRFLDHPMGETTTDSTYNGH